MKYYFLLIAALLLLGCANRKIIDNSNKTKIFSANYFEVNKAIVNYLLTEGWEIENVDETNGLIITTFREFWSYHQDNQWIRLSLKLKPLSDNKTKIYIIVSALTKSKFRSDNRVIRERNLNDRESRNFCEHIFSYLENHIKHRTIEFEN